MTLDVLETDLTSPAPSAVSWPAILGGAAAALAVTTILLSLGTGFGLAGASPWGDVARTAGKVGVYAGIWLIITQWIASAAGGYLTGRLRVRWSATHLDEVHFRDTANGFLSWAVATAVVAAIAASSGTSATTGAAQAGQQLAAPSIAADADALYRTPSGDLAALAPARAEAERILGVAAARGNLAQEDHDYLVASIAARTSVDPAEAARRVDTVVTRERQALDDARATADKARKAASALAIVTALSLLVGAFIASVAAALGGRQRDEHA